MSTLTRNPDYWGKPIYPLRRGTNSTSTRSAIEHYGDGDVLIFEAFKRRRKFPSCAKFNAENAGRAELQLSPRAECRAML